MFVEALVSGADAFVGDLVEGDFGNAGIDGNEMTGTSLRARSKLERNRRH